MYNNFRVYGTMLLAVMGKWNGRIWVVYFCDYYYRGCWMVGLLRWETWDFM